MWQDEGRYGERLLKKIATNFCQSIFSEGNLAFFAYYFEATTKSNCMRLTNCGCWEMWDNVGEGGVVCGSLAKQTI